MAKGTLEADAARRERRRRGDVVSLDRSEPGDRVVVTGAAGFIGSAVMRALLARGAHVVALLEPGARRRPTSRASTSSAGRSTSPCPST